MRATLVKPFSARCDARPAHGRNVPQLTRPRPGRSVSRHAGAGGERPLSPLGRAQRAALTLYHFASDLLAGRVDLRAWLWSQSIPVRLGLVGVVLWSLASVAATVAKYVHAWGPLCFQDPTATAIYHIQRTLTKPLIVKFAAVMLLVSPLWLAVAALYRRVAGRDLGFALYNTFLLVFQVNGTDDEGAWARLFTGAVSIIGALVTGVLLGVVVTDVEKAAKNVLQGNGAVVEAGHVLLLRWTPESLPMLRQLATAQKENLDRTTVVVLGDLDKDELEDAVADLRSEFPAFNVLTREGRYTQRQDLARVAAGTASKVILLLDDSQGAEPREVVQHVLSTAWHMQSLRPAWQGGRTDLVVGSPSAAASRDWQAVAGQRGEPQGVCVTFMDVEEDVGKLIAQAAVQPGLYDVLSTLASQELNSPEFYVCDAHRFVGATYQSARRSWRGGVVVDIYRQGADSPLMLNPPDDVVIRQGDRVVVLAENASGDGTRGGLDFDWLVNRIRGAIMRRSDAPQAGASTGLVRAKTVSITVLGLPRQAEAARSLIASLGLWAAPGSTVRVVSKAPLPAMAPLPGVAVTKVAGDPGDPAGQLPADLLQSDTIVVAVGSVGDDTEVIAAVWAVQALAARSAAPLPHLVVLAASPDTRTTLEELVPGASLDVVTPKALSSALMAQVASEPSLKHVFDELFAAGGAEVFMVSPESLGVALQRTYDFEHLEDAARERGLTCLGVQHRGRALLALERPFRLEDGDRIIVLGDYHDATR